MIAPTQIVKLNNGARTIRPEQLNDNRRQIWQNLGRAAGAGPIGPRVIGWQFRGDNLANTVNALEAEQGNQRRPVEQLAAFLMALGPSLNGRGVNKAQMTPAQQNGVFLKQPRLFGQEVKQPIPYQKVITDQQNLDAVLQGFQEMTQGQGPTTQDAGNIISKVKRHEALIATAFNKQANDSVFSGVPRNAVQNLYNIKVKNQRENSIYALQ